MNIKYEYGQHCGDKDCYSCATQRYKCEELDAVSKYESGNIDIDWEAI